MQKTQRFDAGNREDEEEMKGLREQKMFRYLTCVTYGYLRLVRLRVMW